MYRYFNIDNKMNTKKMENSQTMNDSCTMEAAAIHSIKSWRINLIANGHRIAVSYHLSLAVCVRQDARSALKALPVAVSTFFFFFFFFNSSKWESTQVASVPHRWDRPGHFEAHVAPLMMGKYLDSEYFLYLLSSNSKFEAKARRADKFRLRYSKKRERWRKKTNE